MTKARLTDAIRFLLFMFLFFGALYYARSFLIPLVFAGLLSMLLLPASTWLEHKGIPRVPAIILTILLLITVVSGLVWLIGWQLSSVINDITVSEQQV